MAAADDQELILKSLSGTATEIEKDQLARWISQSSTNRKIWEDYEKVWKLSGQESLPDFNVTAELKKLDAILDQEATTAHTLRPLHSLAFKVAASITLLLVCSFLIYQVVFRTEVITTESGLTKLQVTFPDGSTAWLNERSKITYTSDFENERRVEFTGEGFFDVVPNAVKPFIIRSPRSEVKVLGTSFNVRAYEQESEDQVYVVTGKVNLSGGDDGHGLVLNPGQQGIYNKYTRALSRISETNPNLIAWKSKQLIFKKTSLQEVSETLETYFQISVTVKNPDLQKCRFTGSFQDPTLEEVIEALSIALNLDIVHQNKNYTFEGDGC
jgi:ferric-dicitrate binding protein FerR (iron transport regulator)